MNTYRIETANNRFYLVRANDMIEALRIFEEKVKNIDKAIKVSLVQNTTII